MTRSVKVKLDADVAGYVAPVDVATESTERLDDKVDGLNHDLEKLPAATAAAAAAMKLLGGEADGVRGKLNDVGPDAVNSLQLIDRQIDETRGRMRQFAEDFNKTGSADSLAGLLGAKSDLSKLQSLKKDVTTALEDAAKEGEKALSGALETAGQEGSKSLFSSLQGTLSTPVLGPITVGAVTAAIIAASPAIGATIGAAVIGGGGLGLIGLGIASQVSSPPVVAEFGRLKGIAKDTFTEAGSSFGPVLVGGMRQFEGELQKIEPEIERVESRLAPIAGELFSGVIGFVDKLGPGIDAISRAAGPVLGQLAAELPELGHALSDMLSDIASGGPGAAMALHDLLHVIEGVAEFTGAMIGGLEKAYGWLRLFSSAFGGHLAENVAGYKQLQAQQDGTAQSADNLRYAMQTAAASIDLAGGEAMSASDQFGGLITKLGQTNDTADMVAGAMSDKVFGALMSADEATLHWNESLTKLSDSFKENGKQLDITTAKGQANREAVLSAVQANIQQYDTNIKLGMSAQDAAAAYDANTAALDRQLRKAGLTESQINSLIGRYKGVPKNVDTDIAVNGLTNAINDLNDLIRLINGLHSKTITIAQHVYTYTSPSQTFHGFATGGMRRAAVGMFIPPSDPGTVLTGEPQTGGEMLTPLRGISQAAAMAQTRVIGDAYGFDVTPRNARFVSAGGGTTRHEFVFADSGATDLEKMAGDAVMYLFRKGKIQLRTR